MPKIETGAPIRQIGEGTVFKIRHLMISNVNGAFKAYDASIYTTGKDLAVTGIDLRIEHASTSRYNFQDKLQMAYNTFFRAGNHNHIRFISCPAAIPGDGGDYEFLGEIRMKGIFKKIRWQCLWAGRPPTHGKQKKRGLRSSGR